MSNAPSNANEQCRPAMARTDVRNGRTNGDPLSPSEEISPDVTRARTYGISAELDQLIDLIATACNERPVRMGCPHTVERDPKWRLHRAQARAAGQDRDVCAFDRCYRAEGEPGDGYCHRHYPDEVAIERAMQGERLELMPHERLEAVRRLHRSGHGWNVIQERLGVSGRTIAKALEVAA
jgi:hypothetical protein